MKTSPAGIALICQFENCKLEAYPDSSSRRLLTVGYGHTGAGVSAGQCITQERAEQLLRADLVMFESVVNSAAHVPLTQGQFDACVSLTFNIGPRNFKDSTLLAKLNAGDVRGAALEFPRWDHAGAGVLNGLTRRRAAEAAIFSAVPTSPAGITSDAQADQV
jgi:lysozyme